MEKNPDSILENETEQTPEPAVSSADTPKKQKSIGTLLLGLLISALSVVGAVSVVTTAIGWIQESADTTYLHDEMYYYLEPLMFYAPEPFEDAAKNPQDVFLNAAAYRVMTAEQIRMLREKDESCVYAVDDNGRIAVPAEEIEASYKVLFGPEAKPEHKSLEDSGLEYDESDACYYVPFQSPTSLEQPIVVEVESDSDEYRVRLGFVPVNDMKLDQYGRTVEPTEEMATHFKTYTLKVQEDESYYIYACKDE